MEQKITNLVLMHSMASTLFHYTNPELKAIYNEEEKKVNIKLLQLLTLAYFTASPTVTTIRLSERVKDIETRYGVESHITKHAKSVEEILRSSEVTKDLIKTLKL